MSLKTCGRSPPYDLMRKSYEFFKSGRHYGTPCRVCSFERVNAQFLKPLLTKRYKSTPFDGTHLVRAYNKIMVYEAMQVVITSKYADILFLYNKFTSKGQKTSEKDLI